MNPLLLHLMEDGKFPGWFFTIVALVGLWKVFEKAGRQGWEAIIPFYNIIVALRLVGKPEWWLVWYFIPIANIIVYVWTCNLLAKSFGKGMLYTIGLVILAPFFLILLGFGDAQYQGPAGAEPKQPEPEEMV